MRQDSEKPDRNSSEVMLIARSLPTAEEFDAMVSSMTISPFEAMGISKRMTEYAEVLRNNFYDHVSEHLRENESAEYGDFTFSRRVRRNYIFPDTPKVQELEEKLKELKRQQKEINSSIKTIHEHMIADGEAIEDKPTIQVVIK